MKVSMKILLPSKDNTQTWDVISTEDEGVQLLH